MSRDKRPCQIGWHLNQGSRGTPEFYGASRFREQFSRKVTLRLMVSTDQEHSATRDNNLDGLEWLKRETTSRDVAMLFLSGHGTNDARGNYHFLPWDGDPARLARACIDNNDFLKYLAAANS
jgi:hypothetical protein